MTDSSGADAALDRDAMLGVDASPDGSSLPPEPERFHWIDASDSHLPPSTLETETLELELADVDGDGDLDVVIACELQRNRLLLNDGAGLFTDVSETNLPALVRDSEDLAVADFTGDGLLDLVFVTEDGRPMIFT